MSKVKDPVCGMMIEPDAAGLQSSFEGTTYYFCSEQCRTQFDSNPASYAGVAETSGSGKEDLEQHEPPYTKAGGIVSPKFGSAGSGGAEYERGPESHDN